MEHKIRIGVIVRIGGDGDIEISFKRADAGPDRSADRVIYRRSDAVAVNDDLIPPGNIFVGSVFIISISRVAVVVRADGHAAAEIAALIIVERAVSADIGPGPGIRIGGKRIIIMISDTVPGFQRQAPGQFVAGIGNSRRQIEVGGDKVICHNSIAYDIPVAVERRGAVADPHCRFAGDGVISSMISGNRPQYAVRQRVRLILHKLVVTIENIINVFGSGNRHGGI